MKIWLAEADKNLLRRAKEALDKVARESWPVTLNENDVQSILDDVSSTIDSAGDKYKHRLEDVPETDIQLLWLMGACRDEAGAPYLGPDGRLVCLFKTLKKGAYKLKNLAYKAKDNIASPNVTRHDANLLAAQEYLKKLREKQDIIRNNPDLFGAFGLTNHEKLNEQIVKATEVVARKEIRATYGKERHSNRNKDHNKVDIMKVSKYLEEKTAGITKQLDDHADNHAKELAKHLDEHAVILQKLKDQLKDAKDENEKIIKGPQAPPEVVSEDPLHQSWGAKKKRRR